MQKGKEMKNKIEAVILFGGWGIIGIYLILMVLGIQL